MDDYFRKVLEAANQPSFNERGLLNAQIPPEDQIARLRPINPQFVRLLAESAARVGLTERSRPKNMADPEKPVLVLNRRRDKVEPEPEPEKTYYGPEQRDKPAPIDEFVTLLERYGQR